MTPPLGNNRQLGKPNRRRRINRDNHGSTECRALADVHPMSIVIIIIKWKYKWIGGKWFWGSRIHEERSTYVLVDGARLYFLYSTLFQRRTHMRYPAEQRCLVMLMIALQRSTRYSIYRSWNTLTRCHFFRIQNHKCFYHRHVSVLHTTKQRDEINIIELK